MVNDYYPSEALQASLKQETRDEQWQWTRSKLGDSGALLRAIYLFLFNVYLHSDMYVAQTNATHHSIYSLR